jgi:hypothetical protein
LTQLQSRLWSRLWVLGWWSKELFFLS